MDIKITTNADSLVSMFNGLITKQLPFAMAKTLTGLAFDVRDEETAKLDRYFKVRTKWTKKTLKAIAARKGDFPHQFSIIGVRDKIMALNVTGGEREGGALPGAKARDILNPGSKTLGPAYFPGKLIQVGDTTDKGKRGKRIKGAGKRKAFVFKSTKGATAGLDVIGVRRTDKRTPIDILYIFNKNPIHVKQHWPLVDNTRKIVSRNYADKLRKNIDYALRTAK